MPWAKNEPETVQAKRERLRKFRGQFDLGIDYIFGIFSKDEKTLIGSTGLHNRLDGNARKIGYWINSRYLKQGYATEAVKALMKVGFVIEGLDRIEIRCTTENIASQGIPKKLGFLHEGTLKNRMTNAAGQPEDMMIWTKFKSDYLQEDHSNFYFKAFDIINEEIRI